MDNFEKVKLLNTLNVIDYDCSADEVVYILVELNQKTLSILNQILPDATSYINKFSDDGSIDISLVAFQYCCADYWHQNSGFVIFTKEELMNKFEELQFEKIKLENEIKSYKSTVKVLKKALKQLEENN